MKKITGVAFAFAIVLSFGLGLVTLIGTPVRAVDNPCDPTYNMLKNCKAQHGHWDSSCCCCKLH